MDKKSYLLFIFISIILILALFYKNYELQKELINSNEEYIRFFKIAKKIDYLKKNYDNRYTMVLKEIKNIKKPDFEKIKKEFIELSFSHLNSKELDKILKKIINNNIEIIYLKIANNQKECSLELSIKK